MGNISASLIPVWPDELVPGWTSAGFGSISDLCSLAGPFPRTCYNGTFSHTGKLLVVEKNVVL